MEQKKLPSEFFEAEYRCGYYVTEKMKQVWARELELLNEFDRVCTSYGLTYFLDGGTLLGAVRHKGFIPWDDDVDVIMPRKDYDKLWEIAHEAFCEPYFFQTSLSEKGFFRTHAQLRRSDTTGFIELDRHKSINKGIFLDIFVLDGVPSKKSQRKRLKRKLDFQKKLLAYRYDVDFATVGFKRKMLYLISRVFYVFVPFEAYFNKFNKKTLAKYSHKDTETVGDLTLEWRENVHWRREWYENTVRLEFENLLLCAPSGYDEILTRQYGDYMKIPDDISAKNGRSHDGVTFDPNTPYKDYFEKTEAGIGEE